MLSKGCTNTYLRPVSYFFLFITIAITMISFCTTDWHSTVKIQPNTTTYTVVYQGIWKTCKDHPDFGGTCWFLPEKDKDKLQFDISEGNLTAVRALMSMAVMVMLGALGYPPFYKNMSSGVLKIGMMSILTAIAGTCTFIAMLIMTHEIHSLDPVPAIGFSYITGWVGTGLSFFTASLLYVASKDNIYVEGLY